MKVVNGFFTLYRGILYTVIALYLLVAIAPMIVGIQPFMVVSGSMEPTIHTGALAYVNKRAVDVEENDIIAFNEGSSEKITVIHRVVAANDDGTYTTKGDANTNEDFAPINKDQILGTVIFNIPKLGYVTNFLQSTKGIIAAVILIVIALVSSFITDSREDSCEQETNIIEESRLKLNENEKNE